jgi:hypothetical protein
MPSETFGFTGSEQTWTVPSGISKVKVNLLGGTSGYEAYGGGVEGYLSVAGGETLYIYVGEGREGFQETSGGWPNGGDGGVVEGSQYLNDVYAQGGGGSTDIRQSGNAWSDVVALAGGGGGEPDAGWQGKDMNYGDGSKGGADVGEDAENITSASGTAYGGDGGSQSIGGTASGPGGATDGSNWQGGDGGTDAWTQDSTDESNEMLAAGGGGGGGYYGGGGGGAVVDSSESNGAAAGGGGGSNYTAGLDTVTSNTRGANSNREHGQATITYVYEPDSLTAQAPDASSIDLSWNDPNNGNIDGFRIYRSTQAGVSTSDTQIADVSAGTTTYTDSGLQPGTEYHYIITAYQSGLESGASNEASAVTSLNITIDGDQVTGITIDGETVTGITIDGDTIF